MVLGADNLIGHAGAGTARGLSWPKTALAVAALFVFSRLLLFAIYAWTVHETDPGRFVQQLCQWDCGWYLEFAQKGLDAAPHAGPRGDAANWAFFPLFPLLTAGLSQLLSIPHVTAGAVLSNTFVAATAAVAHDWFQGRPRSYLVFCALLFLGPFSFYFATLYTESLALLEAALCFYFLKRRRYVAAGAAAALLSATRSIGVFLAFALLAAAWEEHRSEGGRIGGFPRRLLGRPDILLGVVLAPLGTFAYMAYLYWQVGDALAFSHIQRGWEREFGNPATVLIDALSRFDLLLVFVNQNSQFWNGLWAVLGLGLAGYLAWRRRLPEAVFSFFGLLVPLSTGILSMPRYTVGLFPLQLAASELLDRTAVGRFVVLPALLMLSVALAHLWFRGFAFLV